MDNDNGQDGEVEYALTILYSFIAATFILPSVLFIWTKRKKKALATPQK